LTRVHLFRFAMSCNLFLPLFLFFPRNCPDHPPCLLLIPPRAAYLPLNLSVRSFFVVFFFAPPGFPRRPLASSYVVGDVKTLPVHTRCQKLFFPNFFLSDFEGVFLCSIDPFVFHEGSLQNAASLFLTPTGPCGPVLFDSSPQAFGEGDFCTSHFYPSAH